jgi:hypothetical protein
MTGENGSREEVPPMTAETVTLPDRHALDGGVYREVVTVRAGETVAVDVPYRVELRPAELVGPRRKG